MTRIMVVRHSFKGNGNNAPKNHLSPEGEVAARALGKNLPESMKSASIDYIGGSIHSRSLHTALLIALGAGSDPLIMPSMIELGSEKQFWQMTTLDDYNAAITKHAGNTMLAVKEIFSPNNRNIIREGMVSALHKASIGNRIILGTHNPWIQFLYEVILGKEYYGNAPELSYIVVDVDSDQLTLVETNLPAA